MIDNMEIWNCNIVELKECDILYQATYTRHCDNCGFNDMKEHQFCSILKSGSTLDIDNWKCPHCGQLRMTKIEVKGEN